MSKRVPLVGEELIAYEEEQNRIKKEETLKAALIKEESKASHGADVNVSDPMVIDVSKAHSSPDGMITRITIPFLTKLRFILHFISPFSGVYTESS